MRPLTLPFAALLILLSLYCASRSSVSKPAPPGPSAPPTPRPLILVGLDGFRWDAMTRGRAPNLDRLAARGVRAAMKPVFPSLTFPNQYALVTDLYPEHHGIVANEAYDPELDAYFSHRVF
jgi:predicted AlkP superfamily pyrophosphatase or phosphodiesterase